MLERKIVVLLSSLLCCALVEADNGRFLISKPLTIVYPENYHDKPAQSTAVPLHLQLTPISTQATVTQPQSNLLARIGSYLPTPEDNAIDTPIVTVNYLETDSTIATQPMVQEINPNFMASPISISTEAPQSSVYAISSATETLPTYADDSTVSNEEPTYVLIAEPTSPTYQVNSVVSERPANQIYDHICKESNCYSPVIPHCDKYVECKDYVPIQYSCPDGLHFNSNAQWPENPCEHPSNVRCTNNKVVAKPQIRRFLISKPPVQRQTWRRQTLPPVLPTLAPLKTVTSVVTQRPVNQLHGHVCKKSNCYSPVAPHCDKYVECKDYVPIQYSCPDGLHFNNKAQWPENPCEHPSNVRCVNNNVVAKPQNRRILISRPPVQRQTWYRETLPSVSPTLVPVETVPSVVTQRPVNQLHGHVCKKSNCYSPVAPHCDKYVECRENVPTQYSCPDGLHFNRNVQWPQDPCEHPSKVSCMKDTVLAEVQNRRYPIGKPMIRRQPWSRLTVTPTSYPKTATVVTENKPAALTYVISPTTLIPTRPTVTSVIRQRPVNQLYDHVCKVSNGYSSVPSHCDKYVECKENVPTRSSCPDGLHFNPRAQWPENPCEYPSNVQCIRETFDDNVQPTTECPLPYGFFPLSSSDCGMFLMCENGISKVMKCPPGLGFNFNTNTCDWPVNIPGCNPEALEGFTCPTPLEGEQHLLIKYRYVNSCNKYVTCHRGHPRLLSCDVGYSFDEASGLCMDSELVPDCAS